MKTSSPETPKPPSKRSILLIGPPGGGKTTLAMQFPKVCFLDCDLNLDGPERFLRTKLKELTYSYVSVTQDDQGKPVPVDECFDRLLMLAASLRNDVDIETVCVDGVTMINEFVVRKVLKAQGNKTAMEPHFWTPFKSELMKLFVQTLRSLNKTTLVTCHEVIIEKPSADKSNILNPVVVGYRPAVQGGITDYFGGFFTDMWRCTCVPAPANRVEFRLQVVRDDKSDLKNSVGLPSEGFTWKEGELIYSKLAQYLK